MHTESAAGISGVRVEMFTQREELSQAVLVEGGDEWHGRCVH